MHEISRLPAHLCPTKKYRIKVPRTDRRKDRRRDTHTVLQSRDSKVKLANECKKGKGSARRGRKVEEGLGRTGEDQKGRRKTREDYVGRLRTRKHLNDNGNS